MSRAIVLYHGFITDDTDFGNLYEHIDVVYDKVVRCIFPGHGLNPNYKEFTVEDTFRVALEAFDKTKAEYDVVDIVGFSMGGAMATYVAKNRDAGKLVLLAPANKYINPRAPFSAAKFWFEKFKTAVTHITSLEVFRENIRNEMAVYIENEKITIENAFKRIIPNYTFKTLTVFNKIIKKCNENLDSLDNEMLIVWGKLDQLVPIDSCEWLYSIAKNENKQFLVLDDISHLMLISKNSDQIIENVMNFLEDKNERKII